jgi:hypothetical protein
MTPMSASLRTPLQGTSMPTLSYAPLGDTIAVKATPAGTPHQWSLTLVSDGSTLVATSNNPLADACRALRGLGARKTATCEVRMQRNDGVFVPYHVGEIGTYGFNAISAT